MPVVLATASDPAAAQFTLPSGGTIYFRLLLATPEQSREASVSVRHIPGGDVNIVDLGGLQPTYIRGQALFASYADFVTMRDTGLARSSTLPGQLTYTEGSWQVFATKISRTRVLGNTGYMIANVEFLVNA